MSRLLKEIKSPISTELSLFEGKFRESLESKVPLLDRIMYYIYKRKGKQIRPMFVFLSAQLHSPISESTYTAASLIELLHTASLVHDDIVDDAHKRRGFFSINALWKNKIAVLVGDYLLSKGLLLAIEHEEYRILKLVSQAVKEISEGELMQIEKARKLDIDENVYYDIIRMKTASLISASCAAGAASAGVNGEELEDIKEFGYLIGMAFQIKDDLFDYGKKNIGKPLGIDIQEKKMTLPLIYALQHSTGSQKRRIKNIIKRHSKDKKKVNEVIQFVKESGGIEYAVEKMNSFKNEAFEILKKFPNNEARESLMKLVNFVTERQN